MPDQEGKGILAARCPQGLPSRLPVLRFALRLAIIPSTLEVTDLWVSAVLLAEAKGLPHLEARGELQALPFDEKGNLLQNRLFPHAVRGKRNHPAFQ